MALFSVRFSPFSWLYSLLFGLALSIVLLLNHFLPANSQSFVTIAPPATEIRGVWLTNVDSEVLLSPSRLEEALQQLGRLHFNTVYPTVWNWGYTLYPSPTAQRLIGSAIDPGVPGWQEWDMLATAIAEGHQQGLTVIPWFEFGFMAPAASELVNRHPDWLTNRRDGSQVWQDGIYERRWLNPFKPEVQQFILNLILEVVTRYNIDGIQFDDHLGLPAEFGYDNFTIQLYRQEHQGKLPPTNSQDSAWVKWRSDKLTAFMTQIFQAVKARKSNVLISLSPNSYDFAYHHFLQDWRTWEQRGLVEELILQVYNSNLQSFSAALARPEVQAARSHIPTAIGILTGLKDHPVSMRQVQQQANVVRSQQFSGISLFFYESLWNLTHESADDRQSTIRALFPTSVNRPSL